MDALKCDVCGGNLTMKSGGNLAVCDCCGVRYSTERMREKVQEIRGSVQVEGEVAAKQTGTQSDISQWRALVQKYYDAGDFLSAEQIVKKILEASPADDEAGHQYEELQVLKYMEIKNGVLVKYTGQAATIKIPACVSAIKAGAFQHNDFIANVVFPNDLTEIGNYAFIGCSSLCEVSIPSGITRIGSCAFESCSSLRRVSIPDSVEIIGASAFYHCDKLGEVSIPERLICDDIFGEESDTDCGYSWSFSSPWYIQRKKIENELKQREYRRQLGKCQYCGGKITGLFKMKCSRCGKPLDY